MGGKSGGSQEVTIGYKYFADVHLQACHGVSIVHRGFVAENCLWNYCPVFTEYPYPILIGSDARAVPAAYQIPPGYNWEFFFQAVHVSYQPVGHRFSDGTYRMMIGGPNTERFETKADVACSFFVQMASGSFGVNERFSGCSATIQVGLFTLEFFTNFPDGNTAPGIVTLRITRRGTVLYSDVHTFIGGSLYLSWDIDPIALDGTRGMRVTASGFAPFVMVVPNHYARAMTQGKATTNSDKPQVFKYPPRQTVRLVGTIPAYYTTGWASLVPYIDPSDRPITSGGSVRISSTGTFRINVPIDPVEVTVNQEGLFGGEEREGGVGGKLWLFAGHPDQTKCDALLSAKKADEATAPLYRGVAGVFFSDFYWGTQPYIKPVSVTVGRTQFKTSGESQWMRPFATWPSGHWCAGDMNPVHIIREAYTDDVWGLGVSEDMMGTSFEEVALQAFDEGLGLSLVWVSETAVEEFVGEILRSIDAVIYQHPITGLYEIKLIRADYVKASLPVLDGTNSKVLKIGTPSGASLINQVTVKFNRRMDACTSGLIDQEAALIVQNPGAIMSAKRVINQTMEYPGITNDINANRAALRDLSMLSQPLRTLTIQTNRKNYNLLPGDVFVLNNPDNGIAAMVFRVGRRTESPLANGSITLECVQDLFDVRYAFYQAPPPPIWELPDTTAKNFPAATLIEPPLPMLLHIYGSQHQIDVKLDPGKYPVAMVGTIPNDKHIGYKVVETPVIPPNILSLAGGAATRDFAPAFKITTDMDALDDLITVPPELEGLTALLQVGGVYLVGTSTQGDHIDDPDTREIISVVSKTPTNITIARGVWDTLPAPIPAGTWVISLLHGKGASPSTYTAADTAHLVGVPSTNTQLYTETVDSPYFLLHLDVNARRDAPNPPGNVRLNGSYDEVRIYGAESIPSLILEWNYHEEGELQDNPISYYTNTNYRAADSTTEYWVKWKGNDETVWHTYNILPIDGTSYELTLEDEKTTRNILAGAPSGRLVFPGLTPLLTLCPEITMTVVARKNGVESINNKVFKITRIGYGYNIGISYGGDI